MEPMKMMFVYGSNIALAILVLAATVPAETAPATSWTISIGSNASLISESFKQQIWGAEIDVGREQNPELTDWRHQATTLTLDAVNSLTEQGGTALRYHRYDGVLEHRVYLWHGLYANALAADYSKPMA